MEQLSGKNRILIGITLFSMFFGAGNLIFPSFLGAQAGTSVIPAMLGFSVSAIGIPVLGVAAVTKAGGLEKLAGRVHPKFAFCYIVVLYLCIGPCLAIPRTASTSFSMFVSPFKAHLPSYGAVQLIYSLIFFLVAAIIAMKPEKLTEYLGKKLTPCLLVLIILVFAGSVIKPAGDFAEATGPYVFQPAVQGFLGGYMTMDTLAALNFGMIIAMNIRAKGVTSDKAVIKETVRAGWMAGAVLLAVYIMLAYIGAQASQAYAVMADGTETLTKTVYGLFGSWGFGILTVIFVIACLNTCIGLLSCCGKYFHSIIPAVSYRGWIIIFSVVSMVIANVGLGMILEISVPVLNAIYPVAILLIILAYLHPWIKKFPYIYPWSVTLCILISLLTVLGSQGGLPDEAYGILLHIPFAAEGFGWVLPTLAGAAAGVLHGSIKNQKKFKSL